MPRLSTTVRSSRRAHVMGPQNNHAAGAPAVRALLVRASRASLRSATVATGTFFILAVAGCGGQKPAAPFATHDSSGVTIAVSGSPEWGQGAGWTVAAQPVVDISGAGTGETAFKAVDDALRLPGGLVVVADGVNGIRFYEPDGRLVNAVGGSGSGPDQFLSLRGIHLAGDTILAFDAGSGRVVDYNEAGRQFHTTSLIATPGALSYYRLGGPTSLGVLLLPAVFPPPSEPRPGVYWTTLPNVRYKTNGVMRDTVGEFSGTDMYVNGQVTALPLFGRRSSAVVKHGRLYIGSGGTWQYRVYSDSGHLTMVARWAHRPAPVTPAITDTLIQASLAAVQKPSQRAGMQQLFKLMPKPKLQPAYDALVVDSAGDVWLRDYRPEQLGGHAVWHVFGPNGRLLGAVTLPHALEITRIGSDWILGIAKTADGLEHVQVLHLVKGS